jgi:dTDP-4-dehydrorhamnose 3,5-epimerase
VRSDFLKKIKNYNMNIEQTFIKDLVILTPDVFEDERGYFFEAYNKSKCSGFGIDIDFVQDNQSFSQRGTLRGLHYQNPPFAQTKLVRVLQGEIMDVAVDLRKDSPTYGKHFGIRLTAENKKQLLVPQGFAHGFSVLSETAVVLYKCDQFYNKASEGGIRFDDATLNIDWGMDLKDAIVSEKDLVLPDFENCNSQF